MPPDDLPGDIPVTEVHSNSGDTSGSGSRWRRRPLIQAVGAASGVGLAAPLISRPGRAENETDPCAITIEFDSPRVARVVDVVAADITSLTVFYGDGDVRKQTDIDPTRKADYGEAPLRVRYDADADETTVTIGSPDAGVRCIVAFGPDCRSAKTCPTEAVAGDNEGLTADFTREPALGVAHEPVTFTSRATDPDGDIVHYGWDFDGDGTEDATGTEVTHTFTTPGDHDVTHTAIDDFDATVSETTTVIVRKPWGQVDKLAATDGDMFDQFGASVAVAGDTAVVGASDDEGPNGANAGSAYVFARADGDWSQQAKLAAPDGDGSDSFGQSVAVDGDTVVVGADSTYVFTRSGGSWDQQANLVADDGDEHDRFGTSVAVTVDTAVVGASNYEGPGSAYVFTRSEGSWDQRAKLTAADGDGGGSFGRSVAVDGDTAVVGGDSTYVFIRSGGSWDQQAKLVAADHFGRSVAVAGDTVVVGTPLDEDPNGMYAGSAYVFTRTDGSWSQQAKLDAEDGDELDRFGASVAMAGDTAIIGAPFDEDPNLTYAGSAYVFARADGGWSQQAKLAAPDGDGEDHLGFSVAVDGDTAVAGAQRDEDPHGFQAGSAYVFTG